MQGFFINLWKIINFLFDKNFKNAGWLLVLLISFSGMSSAATAPVQVRDRTSQEKDPVSIQNALSDVLDQALKIHFQNPEKARELTTTALKEAREIQNLNLEMRAQHILGRIAYAQNEISLSQAFYDTAISISNEIPEDWYKGDILFRQGQAYHRSGNYLEALKSFRRSIISCQLSNNYKIMGSSYSMMGSIFRVYALYDRAIEYIVKSQLYYQKAGFLEGDAWAAYLLGRIYADLKQPQEALNYYQSSLDLYTRLSTENGISGGVALCHEQIGLIFLDSGNYEKAQEHIEFVLAQHISSGSETGVSSAHKHLGIIEYYQDNFLLAEEYLQKALFVKTKYNDLLSLSGIYEYLGLCTIQKGQLKEGLKDMQKGLEIATSLDQKNIQIDIYEKLIELYSGLKQPDKIIYYQNKLIEVQDQIAYGDPDFKIAQVQAIFELDEKAAEIAELQKQNTINELRIAQHRTKQAIMVIAILMAFVISLSIILLYNKIRNKNIELKNVNSTKDKLFSILAHDLKGPIGSASALSSVLIEQIDQNNTKTTKKYARSLHNSLTNTATLLNELLDWTRSQQQRIEFNPKIINLSDQVAGIKEDLSAQSQNKDIVIQTSIDHSLKVFADEYMLNTILRNLISNAIKFSNPREVIIVSAEVNFQTIRISIKDHGIGMDSETLDGLFNLKINNRTKGTSGETGTGLGLVLVKEFVEKHGGQVFVESEMGIGSIFSFTLPSSKDLI